MKNKLLYISLAANLLLSVLLVVVWMGRSSSDKSASLSNKDVAYNVKVNDGDVVVMGSDRMADCKWSFFLADDRVKNLAVNRNTIADDLKRMDMNFNGVAPQKFFLMYGEQELVDDEPVGTIAANYGKLLDELKRRFPATEVVVISTLPISRFHDPAYSQKMATNIKTLNALVKSMAYKNDYPFLDLFDEFSDEGNLALDLGGADGFYLTKTGYIVLKSRMKDFLN